MRVYISDPSLLRNLQEFLKRADCVAEQARSHELEVFNPSAPNQRQAQRELNVYLASWQARNPGTDAYIIESG
jgi:hypothetical protein